MTSTKPTSEDSLNQLSVIDQHGERIALQSLWIERTVVLVLVRHFGCLFCQEQVAQLSSSEERLRQFGGSLVIVGNGAPTFIEGFRDRTGYRGELYTDPQLQLYRALSLRRDLMSSLSLKTMSRAFSAYGRGHRQTQVQGDPWQQGGVFIISPQGQITYRYVSQFAGDQPSVDGAVAALRARHGAARRAS